MHLGGYGGFGGWHMMWDPTYVLVLAGVALSLIASAMVKSTFSRYSCVRSFSGMTGAQTAQRILEYAGIRDVSIVPVSGHLTDHYNPRTKQVALSDSVYGSSSVAAIAVAAHECGHAVQHAQNYSPLIFRNAIIPITNFGSKLAIPLFIAGLFFSTTLLSF